MEATETSEAPCTDCSEDSFDISDERIRLITDRLDMQMQFLQDIHNRVSWLTATVTTLLNSVNNPLARGALKKTLGTLTNTEVK